MIIGALVAVLLLQSGSWTWTLYEGDGPVVLANEIPDTANLRSTLECVAGSGIAKLSIYGLTPSGPFATLSSGQAAEAAAIPVARGRNDAAEITIRTDHPVFDGFVSGGTLGVTIGEDRSVVTVDPDSVAKLRRFADLCGG
ncbi:hypothetical protein BH10PSE2_BH10PSE2_20540 [soil metagenome]